MGQRTSSIQALQGLYSVVAAFALGLAIEQLIDTSGPRVVFHVAHLPTAGALLFTLVPFYHGAIRHLENTYGDEAALFYPLRLLWDFAILFIEACILLAAALLVTRPEAFLITMLLLWIIDIVWGLTAQFILRERSDIQSWALVNAAASIIYGVLLVLSRSLQLGTVEIGLCILAASTARTVADYRVSWNLYFPQNSS